jgi:hypothetical protein
LELPVNATEDEASDIEKLSLFITSGLRQAASKSIPILERKPRAQNLPKHILELIAERKRAKKRWRTSKRMLMFDDSTDYGSLFNSASQRVKKAIKEHRSKIWNDFLEKIGPNFVSSRPAWQKVNSLRGGQSAKKIPCLFRNGRLCTGDKEKAETFREVLSKRFAGSNDNRFDEVFKTEVETDVLDYKERLTDKRDFEEVSLGELIRNIKDLKRRSSPGSDGIYNLMLQHLSEGFLYLVLRLFNLCLEEGRVPLAWKRSIITMIPKGQKSQTDPNNYRPISLISSLSKLLERIMARRMSGFLERNNLIAMQQSGFRRRRRTTDNLVFHTQKILEAFNKRDRKVLSLSFDIQAAFDAVWHEGLIFKMLKAGIPDYMTKWTTAFLADRSFQVRVNETVSESSPIVTGVPQGSSISPILFGIFINDIPMSSVPRESYSVLYADDLTVSFLFDKVTVKSDNVSDRVRNYLLEIEHWLCKWRMKMAPSKCNYTVFAKSNSTKNRFGLRLFGEEIPHEKIPILLGVSFDECLNFESQVKSLKAKCVQRLNIIKILSHKSWQLKRSTLVSIYNSLVGSVLDYSAFMWPRLSERLKTSIQAVQNNAVRLIFRRSLRERLSSDDLCELAGLTPVGNRMTETNSKYFEMARKNGNPLMSSLLREYREEYTGSELGTQTLLCSQASTLVP